MLLLVLVLSRDSIRRRVVFAARTSSLLAPSPPKRNTFSSHSIFYGGELGGKETFLKKFNAFSHFLCRPSPPFPPPARTSFLFVKRVILPISVCVACSQHLITAKWISTPSSGTSLSAACCGEIILLPCDT